MSIGKFSRIILCLALMCIMVMTTMFTAMPRTSYATNPDTLHSDVGLYTNGVSHVKDIGEPGYSNVSAVQTALQPGVPYTADSMFGSIFEKDKAAGGTDYYLDRVLGVTGAIGQMILQTRGRSLYMRSTGAGHFSSLGFAGSAYAGGATNLGNFYTITFVGKSLSEVSANRFNAPSHAKSSLFITSGGISEEVNVEQKKFITYDNVAVTTVKLTNNGSEDRTYTARATSPVATAALAGATNVLAGTRNISNNANNGLTATAWSTVTIGMQGDGFAINGTNLEKSVTVPAGGSVEFSVVGALWSDDLPNSKTEFDRYAALSPADAFREGVTAFNERWAKDIPYISVPDPATEKAILYRWWGERYNSLDTNESGYAYQFPTTIEGVNLYQNAVVLTQPMHLQDTKWIRNPYLAYGQVFNVGELSGSSAFLDSPGHGSWNNHYSQYLGTSGLEAYSVHGGGTDIANKFAYYFEHDGIGQLEHYDGNKNNLIAYDTNYMPGNDADALTFGYPKSPTANGGRNIERPESAYVWGDFNAAAQLYKVAGASQSKVDAMNSKASDIKTAIETLLWDDEEKMFLTKTMAGTTANGPTSRPNHLTDKTHIPVRESNLYDVYAQNLIDPADANKYVDGYRFLTYGDNHPIFPFYTANQYDKSIVSGGSNNFSNINFTVQYRAVRSALRHYDTGHKWLDEDYAAQLLRWMTWSIYPSTSGNADLRIPNQAEYYSNWNATNKTYNRNNYVHVMLGNMNYIYVEDMGGIQPRLDDKIELWPIDLGYDYFMVNNLRYHGKDVTIVWDKDGSKYGLGAGYSLFIDGDKKVTSDKLGKLTYDPNANTVSVDTGMTVTYQAGAGATFATAVNTPIDDSRVVSYLKKVGLEANVGTNVALGATATASFTQQGARPAAWREFHTPGVSGRMNYFPGAITELERPVSVSAVSDGRTVNEPYWGNYGTTNKQDWVELDFGSVKTIDNVQVYFYNDGQTGGYVPPQSAGVQIYDNGAWKYIPNQTRDYKTIKAKRNDFVFAPVQTDKIRVVVTNKPGSYTAITEIQAFDSGKTPYDMTNTAPVVSLARNANKDGNIATELVATVTDDGLPIGADYTYNWTLVSAPEGATARIVSPNSSGTMVLGSTPGSYTFKFSVSDGELSADQQITIALDVKDAAMDFGPFADISSTGCASWEDQNMVNAPSNPSSSNPGTGQGWGTWGTSKSGNGTANMAQLTYTWANPVDLTRTEIYWYDDGGGTRAPTATGYRIEYSTDGTTWKEPAYTDSNAYANGNRTGRYNSFVFTDAINAKYMRISIWGLSGSGAGTGVLRWRAYGLGIKAVDEPVYVRVGEGQIPTLPAVLGVVFNDDSTGTQPFVWDTITPDMVETANVEPFSVFGVNSTYNLYAEAKVYVRSEMSEDGITISNVENSGSFTTTLGKMPNLPEKAVVSYNDGSRDSFAHGITWNVPNDVLIKPGTYTIYGDVSVPWYVGETSAKAQATLTVVDTDDAMLGILADILEGALAIDTSGYTKASVKDLNDAIADAMAIFEDRDSFTDEEIMDAALAVIDAMENLAAKPSKTHLANAIAQAKAIDANKLINSAKENLLKAIAEAEAVYADEDATQEDIDKAYLALVEASVETGLIKGENWAKLESVVALVKNTQAATYTPASFDAFKTALDKAQAMIADKGAYTQAKVDAAYDTLYNAWRALVRIANFSALQAAVNSAQVIVDNIGDYVASSVTGLEDELASAKVVFANKNSTQTQVDAATVALTTKISNVRIKEDKSKLTAAIKAAKAIDTSLYTEGSVKALNSVLKDAKAMLKAPLGTYTQAQVDDATKNINVSVMGLVDVSATTPDESDVTNNDDMDTAKDSKKNVAGKGAAALAPAGSGNGTGGAAATGDVQVASGDAAAPAPEAVQNAPAAPAPAVQNDGTIVADGDAVTITDNPAPLAQVGAMGTAQDDSSAPTSMLIWIALGFLAFAALLYMLSVVRKRRKE